MKEKAITALAREYVNCMGYGLQCNPDNVAESFRWLADRFCLVEKEAVAKLMKEHRKENRGTDKGSRAWFFYNGRLDLLKSLFPELAKEVESK